MHKENHNKFQVEHLKLHEIEICLMIFQIINLALEHLRRAVKDLFKIWIEEFSLLKFQSYQDLKQVLLRKIEEYQGRMRRFGNEWTTLFER